MSQTIYPVVLTDHEDFWDNPTDLVGVYSTKEKAIAEIQHLLKRTFRDKQNLIDNYEEEKQHSKDYWEPIFESICIGEQPLDQRFDSWQTADYDINQIVKGTIANFDEIKED